MSFGAPWFLLALALLPLAALAQSHARRRRRAYAVRFPAAATVAIVAATAPAWRRRLPALLLALAAVTLVGALARPHATVAEPIERATIVLVTDTSRSMLAEDVSPTRMEAAQRAGVRLMENIPEEMRVGLVAYATRPTVVLGPGTPRKEVRLTLMALAADGATATGDALLSALATLRRERDEETGRRAPAAIVLLSDGKTTEGSDPLVAARAARRAGVPVHTVALGTDDGVVTGPLGQEISVPPDPETLRQIAEMSGGDAFEVADGDELDRIYQRLGSQVGTRQVEREVTAAFAGFGFLLLLGGAGAGIALRGRLP